MKSATKDPKQAIPVRWNEPLSSGISVVHRTLQERATRLRHSEHRCQDGELQALKPLGVTSAPQFLESTLAKSQLGRNIFRADVTDSPSLFAASYFNSPEQIYPMAAIRHKRIHQDRQGPRL
jgi:hypothetical protein